MTAIRDKFRGLGAEKLYEVLHYAPSTGAFTWRVTRRGLAWKGKPAGSLHSTGYVLIKIDGVQYKAHRLAWLYMSGEWPKYQIDHVNGDRADNRFANLRQATPSENSRNKKLHPYSHSGVRGVTWHEREKKWIVRIQGSEQRVYLGSFTRLEDAAAAYDAAAKRYFGEFARPERRAGEQPPVDLVALGLVEGEG